MTLKSIVEGRKFESFITMIIIINAITLGIETIDSLALSAVKVLFVFDKIFLGIFVIEIVLKMFIYRTQYFKDYWRIFDFIIVFISVIPSSGPFSVLRSLRILRTLRMISVVPSLKKVVNGLLVAIPGLSAVGAIITLIFYIGSVMATKLFGEQFPEWFGSIWKSGYSLFQVMTLESWSMGIVRPVMEVYPLAWIFFLPFILVTTFTMLNLFIAVIVNAMQVETDATAAKRAEEGHLEREQIFHELKKINAKIEKMVD